MYRLIYSSVLALSLCSTGVRSAECQSPFKANVNGFQLTEQLNCKQATFPVLMNIIPANQTGVAGVWSPKCNQYSPYFELQTGSLVVDYSDTMVSTLSKLAQLFDCNGKPLFQVDRTPSLWTLPSGQKVNTGTRLFAEDESRTLIGYVGAGEDTADGLIVRGPDSTVLAQGAKTFDMATCSATWVVTNSAATVLSANAISFLITLKDNDGFSCIPTTPADSGLSKGGMFGLGFTVGAVVGAAAATAATYFVVNRCKIRRNYTPFNANAL